MNRILRASIVTLLLLMGCGNTAQKKKDEQKDVLLGAPPTAKDDPFFFVAMPSTAEKAETTGTIGTAEPENDNPSAKPREEGVQCFSCVRICAKEVDCSGDEDLICGWGSHPLREVSMTRATAECDGALNLARYAPQWSKIEGSCPIASCR